MEYVGNNSSEDANESSEGISHVMSMRSAAAISLEKRSMRMKKLAARKEGITEDLTVGSVVKVSISDSDRNKRNQGAFIAVFADITGRRKNRLVCKGGVIVHCFDRTQLSPIPSATAALVGLDVEFTQWRSLPTLTLRAAEKFRTLSLGFRIQCSCTSICNTKRCACRRAGLLRNSNCHGRNKKCINHD